MLCSQKPAVRVQAARAVKPSLIKPVRAARVIPRVAAAEVEKVEAKAEISEHDHDDVHPQVSTQQVGAFLSTLVQETNIAEVHLQVGSFELKVRRSTATAPAAAAPVAAPVAAAPAVPAADAAPVTSTVPASLDESIDESLVYVQSPKVGIFRRGKYVGGKRVGKGNAVNEGDQVKKGQTLAYVEQLGTYVPVEAPQAGELVKVLIEEGGPVEYQQVVVEIAPFFGGLTNLGV
mmetsp:Transcript_12676/g.27445  ORF Transcript_12676/g.27445 Transcript_12676/m.27445 type:complete len:233 (-) Transcript_12676:398-1096(-)|eukprot:CAMPEP_0202899926 /NCGR_PEP_ID=MMETSP1392-20130828/9328_1 /ASSEMBLY_ACC=CAM_ASM_000868 /TAXON_ID=225041 /ORGANISM="Chlamydomonas chlamydogama, Strain SAG 11-48b" /LENGTH=232 /DNA_ID=CAMNT_0049586229 /DNA_START=122 /DNA_END=820 /DNA_ORIENTATION=+